MKSGYPFPAKWIPFLRFCVVGGCAAAVHYGVYYLLLRVGSPINLAYITGYIVSFVGNFFATSYFTFSSRPSWSRFVGFAGSHAVNFLLHIVLLNLFLWMGLHELIAPIAVMVVAMIVQYTILRWVYKNRPLTEVIEGKRYALLSIDTEEFDLPREQGVEIDFTEQIAVAEQGTNVVLDLFKAKGIKATFFCTTNFAQFAPKTFARIQQEGHEIASHGCNHFNPQPADIGRSKELLEQLSGKTVNGYRQPRMMAVVDDLIAQAGYLYNSSLHPAFIPGRYMHLSTPRQPFMQGSVLQIPTSVSPHLRLPVFWLACHNYPLALYLALCRQIIRHDGLFVIYFHPYEFTALQEHTDWHIPRIIRHNAGDKMIERVARLIDTLREQNAEFITYTTFTCK